MVDVRVGVDVGGTNTDAVVVDDSHITCTALGGPPGSVLDVTVRNDNG